MYTIRQYNKRRNNYMPIKEQYALINNILAKN